MEYISYLKTYRKPRLAYTNEIRLIKRRLQESSCRYTLFDAFPIQMASINAQFRSHLF
jgi:hypothetical protein